MISKKEQRIGNVILVILFIVVVMLEGGEMATYYLIAGLLAGLFGIIVIKVLNYFSRKKNKPPDA